MATGIRTCPDCGKLFKIKDAGPENALAPKPKCKECTEKAKKPNG